MCQAGAGGFQGGMRAWISGVPGAGLCMHKGNWDLIVRVRGVCAMRYHGMKSAAGKFKASKGALCGCLVRNGAATVPSGFTCMGVRTYALSCSGLSAEMF